VHDHRRFRSSLRSLQVADELAVLERQLDRFERHVEIFRRLAEDAQRMLIGLLLAGRARARVAPHPAQLEGVVAGRRDQFRVGLVPRQFVAAGFVGQADLAPFLRPVVAVEAPQRLDDRRGVLEAHVVEGAQALLRAAQDFLLDLVQCFFAGSRVHLFPSENAS